MLSRHGVRLSTQVLRSGNEFQEGDGPGFSNGGVEYSALFYYRQDCASLAILGYIARRLRRGSQNVTEL